MRSSVTPAGKTPQKTRTFVGLALPRLYVGVCVVSQSMMRRPVGKLVVAKFVQWILRA